MDEVWQSELSELE